MLFWILIALLTAAAILAVLIPLGRAPAVADADTHARQVYRDQLKELERDKADGRISGAEAEAARAEIGRRLLAADSLAVNPSNDPRPFGRRAAALLALAGIPLLSLSLYLGLGAPNLPGAPLAARLEQPPAADDIAALIARVEAHLADDPEDGRGWEVIAPVYFRMGRGEEAIRAYQNAIRLLGSTAERQIALGQAILAVEGGIVTAEAREAFAAANALDPAAPEPRFFLAVAAEQEGDFAEAAALWRDLLAEAPADAPWRGAVAEALANVEPLVASDDAPNAASGDEAEQQAAMIEGMVSGLADRLQSEPNDVDGWLRLIRSYVVLGRADAAAEAARDALAGLADTAARERVTALIAELGVTPAGATTQ